MSNNTVSLSELAKELDIYKSKLTYYVSLGLILPESIVGGMQIFHKTTALKQLKIIEKEKKKGKSLTEIQEILKNEKKK